MKLSHKVYYTGLLLNVVLLCLHLGSLVKIPSEYYYAGMIISVLSLFTSVVIKFKYDI